MFAKIVIHTNCKHEKVWMTRNVGWRGRKPWNPEESLCGRGCSLPHPLPPPLLQAADLPDRCPPQFVLSLAHHQAVHQQRQCHHMQAFCYIKRMTNYFFIKAWFTTGIAFGTFRGMPFLMPKPQPASPRGNIKTKCNGSKATLNSEMW